MKRSVLYLILAIATLVLTALPVSATIISETYSFTNITANSATDAAIGEAQMSLEVSGDDGGGQVLFTFANSGPDASAITDIYLDDASGLLASLDSIVDSGSGVSFSENATPPDLPGGNTISFSADYSADSDSPVATNGVNPGEWVGLYFTPEVNQTIADIIAALDDDTLRAGIHVQAFADGGSESFVTGEVPAPVPEPSTLLLLGIALTGLALFRKRWN